jgi:hypothetical protein
MAAEQIAVSGKAHYKGIPTTTVTFGTPGNQTAASATTHSLTLFGQIEKALDADLTESRDNDNEVIAINRSNKRIRLSFSAKPVGATRDAAITIAEACPYPGDVIVITCTEDTQVAATSAWVDSASCRYTPDGELVIDFVAVDRPQTLVPAS